MPNISVQLRRGTDTEHSSFTGAEGEVTVDTTNDTLRVHDGSTAGGVRLAKLSEVSGGTGTVTSVDSGTGLTGGPITTSGTLALANTAVSPGSYTNTNLTVDAQGRITAASNGSGGAVSKYSTGWQNSIDSVTVANGSTHTITHNLGTDDVTVQVFVATSSAGANSRLISNGAEIGSSGTVGYHAQIQSLGTNSVELQLGSGGYLELSSTGTITPNISFASKYIKVVVVG